VELLVVIGVIALLISILLPALNRAREQASRIKCTSNMRTLMQGLTMYLNDNQGHQPLFGCYATRPGDIAQEYLYPVALAMYVGVEHVSDQPFQPGPGGRMFAYANGIVDGPVRRSVFFCPSDSWQPELPITNVLPSWMGITSYGTCYKAWNPDQTPFNPGAMPSGASFTGAPGAAHYLCRHLSRQQDASNTPVFGHINAYNAFTYLQICCLTTWENFNYNIEPSHMNTLPVAFLDGHVDVYQWSDVQAPTAHGPNSVCPLWYDMNYP
jgi:prepilin-type processing-associated H-X9-DG protein